MDCVCFEIRLVINLGVTIFRAIELKDKRSKAKFATVGTTEV